MIANDWHPLRWLATWRALGRLGIVLTIVLSLVRLPDTGIHIDHGDKYEHAFGYLGLMLWYAQLCSTWRALAWRALGLVALGVSSPMRAKTGHALSQARAWLSHRMPPGFKLLNPLVEAGHMANRNGQVSHALVLVL